MKIEEAIEILKNPLWYNPVFEEYETVEEYDEASKMAIKSLEAQRWIPVSERFPTEDDADELTGLVLYRQSNGWKFTDYWYVPELSTTAITHFMKLPSEVKK